MRRSASSQANTKLHLYEVSLHTFIIWRVLKRSWLRRATVNTAMAFYYYFLVSIFLNLFCVPWRNKDGLCCWFFSSLQLFWRAFVFHGNSCVMTTLCYEKQPCHLACQNQLLLNHRLLVKWANYYQRKKQFLIFDFFNHTVILLPIALVITIPFFAYFYGR